MYKVHKFKFKKHAAFCASKIKYVLKTISLSIAKNNKGMFKNIFNYYIYKMKQKQQQLCNILLNLNRE